MCQNKCISNEIAIYFSLKGGAQKRKCYVELIILWVFLTFYSIFCPRHKEKLQFNFDQLKIKKKKINPIQLFNLGRPHRKVKKIISNNLPISIFIKKIYKHLY